MKLGIIGLPNVGKSTLFNALTIAGAQSANYPFCTIEPNVGVVAVPDKRLDALAEMYSPELYTPAVIEFVARDLETINMELILSDMEHLERRIDKVKKMLKGDKTLAPQLELYERIMTALSDGKCARTLEFSDSDRELMGDLDLITMKPVIYVANVSEDEAAEVSPDNSYYKTVKEIALSDGSEVIPVCAGLEAEIAELALEEKAEFLSGMGITESGLDRLIKAGYSLLGLISYLTAGPKEVRAWTIAKGTKAPQAAGKIHSDFERGFIRAEIVSFDDLMECGSMAAAREKGLVRSEGKDYVMQDGDVTLFRFNV